MSEKPLSLEWTVRYPLPDRDVPREALPFPDVRDVCREALPSPDALEGDREPGWVARPSSTAIREGDFWGMPRGLENFRTPLEKRMSSWSSIFPLLSLRRDTGAPVRTPGVTPVSQTTQDDSVGRLTCPSRR